MGDPPTLEVLRLHCYRLQQELNRYGRHYNAHIALESFLNLIFEHYSQYSAKVATATFDSDFYSKDDRIQLSSLMKDKELLNTVIENLWLGRIAEYTFQLDDGENVALQLDPVKLRNDRPLILLKRSDGSFDEIKFCPSHEKYIYHMTYHPGFPGLIINKEYIKEWIIQNMNDEVDSFSIWPDCLKLKSIVALFCGVDVSKIKEAVLMADGARIRNFLDVCVQAENTNCHFMCMGTPVLSCFLILETIKNKIEVCKYFVGIAVFA